MRVAPAPTTGAGQNDHCVGVGGDSDVMDGDHVASPDGGDRPEAAALRAEVEQLRAELAQARAWAWSAEHRHYAGSWLPYTGDPSDPAGGWDWVYPDWLLSSVEPHLQPWWVTPGPPAQR